jgi:hypothetical protein
VRRARQPSTERAVERYFIYKRQDWYHCFTCMLAAARNTRHQTRTRARTRNMTQLDNSIRSRRAVHGRRTVPTCTSVPRPSCSRSDGICVLRVTPRFLPSSISDRALPRRCVSNPHNSRPTAPHHSSLGHELSILHRPRWNLSASARMPTHVLRSSHWHIGHTRRRSGSRPCAARI